MDLKLVNLWINQTSFALNLLIIQKLKFCLSLRILCNFLLKIVIDMIVLIFTRNTFIYLNINAQNIYVYFQFTSNQNTKCITVASTTSGMIHSVPVAHIAAPPRITGSTVHYYTSSTIPQTGQRTIHHLPQATVTIQSIPGSTSQMIRGYVLLIMSKIIVTQEVS